MDRVLTRRPDGAVLNVTRKAFDSLHRPAGWSQVLVPGVNPNLRVLFVAARGGGERLRSRWPAEALSQVGWRAQTTMGWPMNLSERSLIIFHRPMAEDVLKWVRAYQEAGHTVLVSEDDDLNCIPKRNKFQWEPGQRETHDESIRIADGLIVSTSRLVEVYGSLARRTWLCPNYLPGWVSSDEFRATIKKPSKPRPRVGWAGVVATHEQDLLWIKPEMKWLIKGAKFVTVGATETLGVLGVRGEAAGPQKDIEKYLRLMAQVDIGIVPLDNGEDRDFNTGKSWLKSLEYVSLGIPVVATDLPEQRKLLHGTDAGVLVGTPAEMAYAVQWLVNNPAARVKAAESALKLGRAMALENNLTCWTTMLKEAGSDTVR